MHKDFADWYSLVSPSPLLAVLEARWKAIECLTQSCTTPSAALDLVYAALSEAFNEPIAQDVEEALKSGDPSLPLQNRREIALLSASAIVVGLEGRKVENAAWTAAAYYVGTSANSGARIPISYLYELAKQRVNSAADLARNFDPQGSPLVSIGSRNYAAIEDVANVATSLAAAVTHLKAVDLELKAIAEGLSTERTRSEFLANLLLEQSNLLWFLVDNSYRHVPEPDVSAAIAIASSIVDAVRFFPPPSNLSQFIEVALRPHAEKMVAIEPLPKDAGSALPLLPARPGAEAVFPMISILSGRAVDPEKKNPRRSLLAIAVDVAKEIAGLGSLSSSQNVD